MAVADEASKRRAARLNEQVMRGEAEERAKEKAEKEAKRQAAEEEARQKAAQEQAQRMAAEEEARRVQEEEQAKLKAAEEARALRTREAAERLVREARAKPRQHKRNLDNVDGDSEFDDDTDDDDDEPRIVRLNEGANKRPDKPETDKKAVALFGDVPPAIAFRAQPPAGTVFPKEKFVPMYGPETFSDGGDGFRRYLYNTLGAARAPASPAAGPSQASAPALAPTAPATPSPAMSPRPQQELRSTPTSSGQKPKVSGTIQPKQQPQKPAGPSLLEKIAEMELNGREKKGEPSSSKPPSKPQPRPGPVTPKKAAPSLFIERKKPRKPAQKPAQEQKPPEDKGKDKDGEDNKGTETNEGD
ncbi:hypothetical protein VTK56DRAFT_7200 [Thermocarpiscus australiensis]